MPIPFKTILTNASLVLAIMFACFGTTAAWSQSTVNVPVQSSYTSAQEYPTVKLLIQAVSQNGQRCGVSEDGIDAAIRSAARYNRLTLDENSEATLSVSVDAMGMTNQSACAWTVQVAIAKLSVTELQGVRYSTSALICEKRSFGIFSQNDPGIALSSVKQQLDRCLAELPGLVVQ